MPCDYPQVPFCALTDARMACSVITHTVLARTGPVNCPRASHDIDISVVLIYIYKISAYEITPARWCGHMRFMGSIRVLTTFWPRDFKNPYVYPLEFRKVHMQVVGTRTISRVGRAGPMRDPCGAHMTQQTTVPLRAPVRSLYECLQTFYGHKIIGSPSMNVVLLNCHGSEIFKESCGFTRHVMRSSIGSQGFGPYGTRKLLGSSM